MPNLFPKFLKVTNKGQANYVKELESKLAENHFSPNVVFSIFN